MARARARPEQVRRATGREARRAGGGRLEARLAVGGEGEHGEARGDALAGDLESLGSGLRGVIVLR